MATDPSARPCVPVPVPAGPDGIGALLPALAGALAGTGPAIAPLPDGVPAGYADRLRAAVRPDDPVSGDVAVVAATSGSTGEPAGVLLPAAALQAAAEGFAARYGRHRWVAALPLHHAGGLLVAVRSIVDGTTPVAVASLGGADRFSVTALAEATRAARAGADAPLAVSLVPAMLAVLAQAGPGGIETLRRYDVVLVGGAAAPPGLVEPLRAQGVRIVLSYGMTETCGGVAFDGVPLARSAVSAGPDRRLIVCGDQVARGYRDGRARLRWSTRDGVRCFSTDDLGQVDADGRVHVTGRADDVVQVAGAAVSLDAVALRLRADPDVLQAEVVAVPDESFGARLVAFVVLDRGAAVDPTARAALLGRWVAESLGSAARPRAVEVLDALPLLPSGKPDRRLLLDRARQSSG